MTLSGYEYSLNGGPWTNLGASTSIASVLGGIVGTNTLRVRAYATDGTRGPIASKTFTMVEGYDDVVNLFRDRLSAAGYTISTAKKRAYNTFVTNAKAHGYWSKLKDVSVFEGTTIAHSCVKLHTTGSYPTSLTNSGFTNAAILPNGGIQGDGTGFFKSGVNHNTFTSGLGGISGYVLTDGVDNNFGYIGGIDANLNAPYAYLSTRGYSTTTTAGWGGSFASAVAQCTRGFYQARRTSLSALEYRANRTVIATSTTASDTTTRNQEIFVMAGANGSAGNSRFRQALGFFALDDGTLTSSEAESFREDVETLMLRLGRITPALTTMKAIGIIGQSLAKGQGSGGSLSTTPVYNARMPSNGAMLDNGKALLMHGIGRLYETGSVETIASSMARQISSSTRAATTEGNDSEDRFVANASFGGYGYSQMKKGTTIYQWMTDTIAKAVTESAIFNKSFEMSELAVVHGESDADSTTYEVDIETWRRDYQADLFAITGQTGALVMFHSQPSSWQMAAGFPTTAKSPYAMLAAHKNLPTKHRLVCAKYFLPYSDGIHLTGQGYRILGDYYGKAIYRHQVLGIPWEPLRPSSVVRAGNTITVSFVGRVGNLVLDTTNVSDPGNYGFEWVQTGGTARTISSVALSGDSTQVIITLSGDPGAPTAQRLRYAYTAVGGQWAGPTTGPRGCLRDSDTTVGVGSGGALVNWCVHFDEAVS